MTLASPSLARHALSATIAVAPLHPDPATDEFFAPQSTARNELPDPRPLLENLTRCVIEVLAGARDLEQIARWVTDDVYRHLLKRVVLAARARHATGRSAARPTFAIGLTTVSEPRDGVVEGVVIVRGK